MKVMRIMLLLKQSYQELFRLIHPRSISRVKMGQTVVSEDVLSGVWGFFILWIGLLVLAAFVVAASGVDVVTSFAASLACIGNIGPGIGGGLDLRQRRTHVGAVGVGHGLHGDGGIAAHQHIANTDLAGCATGNVAPWTDRIVTHVCASGAFSP